MSEPLPLQAELSAMKDQLAQTSAERRERTESKIKDLLHALDDIDWTISDDVRVLAARAEQIFKSYPVASVASAFLVGLLIGRVSGRRP